jgi:hypothetical protein
MAFPEQPGFPAANEPCLSGLLPDSGILGHDWQDYEDEQDYAA